MLHEIFALERPLINFDVETTGFNPQVDRITEIAFQMFTSEGLKKEWRSLINPGIPIPAEITRITGISDRSMTLCQGCQLERELCKCEHFHVVPAFAQLAPNLSRGFSGCDFSGKNPRFDLRFMAAEMQRASIQWSYANACVIDAERLEQIGEPRTLSDLYKKHTGKQLTDAHQAMADVKATAEVLVRQMYRYKERLPRTLDALHKLQWPGWIDPEGKFKFIDGVPCFGSWGKYSGQPMAKADAGYWEFILKSDFSADVKQIAMKARVREFPVPPQS